jgi:hypoxanthine phosphoribosyltransferase
MEEVKVLDKNFRIYIPNEKLQERITELAIRINNDMKGKEVVFFGILNGVFLFAADLFRRIDFPAQISFLKLASYDGMSSTGKIKELIGWNEDVTGKTIVVIEDIIDTGITIERIVGELALRKAKEVKIVTLLLKPDAYTKQIPIDYVGFEIPNDFVVGYGLDYDGYGRNLDSIYTLIK